MRGHKLTSSHWSEEWCECGWHGISHHQHVQYYERKAAGKTKDNKPPVLEVHLNDDQLVALRRYGLIGAISTAGQDVAIIYEPEGT